MVLYSDLCFTLSQSLHFSKFSTNTSIILVIVGLIKSTLHTFWQRNKKNDVIN